MCVCASPLVPPIERSGRLGLGVLERQDPNPRLRKYFPTPTLIPFFRSKKVLQVSVRHLIE